MCINVNNVHGNGDVVMLNTIVAAVRIAGEIEGIAWDDSEERDRFDDGTTHVTGCESSKTSAFRSRRM
jgi:hypothetical protein